MNRTTAPIPNPTAVRTKTIVTTIGTTSTAVALGIKLKSKGNMDTSVATTAMPIILRII